FHRIRKYGPSFEASRSSSDGRQKRAYRGSAEADRVATLVGHLLSDGLLELSRVARFREAKRGDALKERSGIAALGGSADDFARAVEGPWLRKKMARAGKRLKISLSGAPSKGEILKRLIKLVVPAALLMSACGATVGDACTTASDCGNQ